MIRNQLQRLWSRCIDPTTAVYLFQQGMFHKALGAPKATF